MNYLALLSVAMAITGAGISSDQDREAARMAWTARNTEASRSEWQRRHGRILTEIAHLREHPWAGSYNRGQDRLGTQEHLVMAPSGGFALEQRSGCGSSGFYDRDFGAVDMTSEGILQFKTEISGGDSGFYHIKKKLVTVEWSGRRYLVPHDEIIDFCGQINGGREPRDTQHGSFYLRGGDEHRKAEGRPSIPEEFEPYLLESPITADVVAVNEFEIVRNTDGVRVSVSTVGLSAGREQGVLPGMRLFLVLDESRRCGTFGVAAVKNVDENQSVAEVRLLAFEGYFDSCDPSPLGMKFSTEAWYNMLEEQWEWGPADGK
jgi:hypothetical protein